MIRIIIIIYQREKGSVLTIFHPTKAEEVLRKHKAWFFKLSTARRGIQDEERRLLVLWNADVLSIPGMFWYFKCLSRTLHLNF